MKLGNRGFTLLEMLISLGIISLMLHVIMLTYQSYHRIEQYVRNDYTAQWYQFVALFDRILESYHVVEVSDKTITVEDAKKQQYYIVQRRHKIYKSKGYHPYLHNVEEWWLSYEEPFLTVKVAFDNGQLFESTIEVNP